MSNRAFLVTGGTGLVGQRLVSHLSEAGRATRILSRDPERARLRLPALSEAIGWDGRNFPLDALRGVQGIVHLSGEPIFAGLPTRTRKAHILASRIDSTRSLVDAISELPEEERPETLVCASAVGIYGDANDTVLKEDSAQGSSFLAEVCQNWEAAAAEVRPLGVRVVSLRIGIVLAAEGGALPRMALPFRLGLGGPLGDGQQWTPWIHVVDLVRIIETALEDVSLEGPVNAVSPEPARNGDFSRCLADVLKRPCLFRVPGFVLRSLLGDLSDELLDSRRVSPKRLLDAGFAFELPELEPAFREALNRPAPVDDAPGK